MGALPEKASDRLVHRSGQETTHLLACSASFLVSSRKLAGVEPPLWDWGVIAVLVSCRASMEITSSKGQRSWWSRAAGCQSGVDRPVTVLNCGLSVAPSPPHVSHVRRAHFMLGMTPSAH